MFCPSLLLTAFLVNYVSGITTHQEAHQERPNSNECYEVYTFTIIYPRGGENVTEVVETRDCCRGYKLSEEEKCERIAEQFCGNISCTIAHAECVTFEKCGKEISLFMNEGSIVSACYENQNMDDLLSCSGVCLQDPCLSTECAGVDTTQMSCFVSGCDCKARWIRLKDRAEVNCGTGDVIRYS